VGVDGGSVGWRDGARGGDGGGREGHLRGTVERGMGGVVVSFEGIKRLRYFEERKTRKILDMVLRKQ
jgi:hypothetical protein